MSREARIAAAREDGSRDPALPLLRVRDGAIVPLGPVAQSTAELPADSIMLIVSLDATNHATGTLYEDAGDGYGYERGHYRLTRFEANIEHGALVVRDAGHEGDWEPPAGRRYAVEVLKDAADTKPAYQRVIQP